MYIPQDPVMLMSMINMKLRDGEYSDFEDLCASLGLDKDETISKLKRSGFEWYPEISQFR